MTTPATTRPRGQLTLKDRLSRLTFIDACKLLGPTGAKLIQKGANLWDIKIEEDVFLGDDLFRLRLPERHAGRPAADGEHHAHGRGPAAAALELQPVLPGLRARRGRLFLDPGGKTGPGAGGPAQAARAGRKPGRGRAGGQGAGRTRRAGHASKRWPSAPPTPSGPGPITPSPTSTSGKSYRVALRGLEPGVSYCSCPDFRTNTLGTCKHILHVLKKVKRRFSPRELKQPYRRKHLAVVLRYGEDVQLAPADARADGRRGRQDRQAAGRTGPSRTCTICSSG